MIPVAEIAKAVLPLQEKVCILRGKIKVLVSISNSAKTKGDGLTQDNGEKLTEEFYKVLDDAKNKAQAAGKAFEDKEKKIALSAGSSEAELREAVKLVDPAVAAAGTLAAKAVAVAEELMRAALPSRLTEGALKVMLCAMRNDPNIRYIRHFWKAQNNKINNDG